MHTERGIAEMCVLLPCVETKKTEKVELKEHPDIFR